MRAYPSPYGVNARPPPRLPQPDHRGRARRGREGRRHLGQRRLGRGPRRRREGLRPLAARRSPATRRWPWTRWAACSATPARSSRTRATPWSPRSTPRCRPSWRSSCTGRSRPPAAPPTPSPAASTPPTAARPWCSTPRPVASWRWPASRRYDPEVWSGGITSKQLERLYSEEAGTPLLSRATQGQFAPGSTWKPMMTAGALENGYSPGTHAGLLLGLPGRQPGLQELRVRRLRLHQLRQGARGLVQHLLLPGRLSTTGRSTAATRPT